METNVKTLLDELCNDDTQKIARRNEIFKENRLQARLDNPIAAIKQLERTISHFQINVIELSTRLEAEKQAHKMTISNHEMAEALYRLGMHERDERIQSLSARLKHETVNVNLEDIKAFDSLVIDIAQYHMDNRDVPMEARIQPTLPGWSVVTGTKLPLAEAAGANKETLSPLNC